MSNVAELSNSRIEWTKPSTYRLARKQCGEIVLQGQFAWQQGSIHGYEWRDIPTVDYDLPPLPES